MKHRRYRDERDFVRDFLPARADRSADLAKRGPRVRVLADIPRARSRVVYVHKRRIRRK